MTATDIAAYVLAGGRGRRLRPLTDRTPKPMLPFLGRPILEGWLHRLASTPIRRVHVLAGSVRAPFDPLITLGQRLGLHVEIHTEPRPLGSGGALRAALPTATSTMLVINGDIVTGADIWSLVTHHRTHAAAATILIADVDDPTGFGQVTIQGNRITSFVEKPPRGPGPALVNAGVHVLERTLLDRPPTGDRCDLGSDILPALVHHRPPFLAVRATRGWADIGTPDRYLAAHARALSAEISWPRPPWADGDASVKVHPTADIAPQAHLVGPLQIGPGAVISDHVHIGPNVVLGAHVRVEPHAHLRDTVIHDNVHVAPATNTTRAILTSHSTVPVPARPRPDIWTAADLITS